MGLTDILTGMLNGPRGASERQGSDQGSGSGGMSPITMALLALLAYKAIKGFGGSSSAQAPSAPADGAAPAGLGLDEILKGGLGGGAGQTQGGGLGDLLAGLGGGGLGGLLAGVLGGGGQTGVPGGSGVAGGGPGGVLAAAWATCSSSSRAQAGATRPIPGSARVRTSRSRRMNCRKC